MSGRHACPHGLVLAAGTDASVRNDEVMDVLKTICAHHHPVTHVIAA
jgi:hypothetical protein